MNEYAIYLGSQARTFRPQSHDSGACGSTDSLFGRFRSLLHRVRAMEDWRALGQQCSWISLPLAVIGFFAVLFLGCLVGLIGLLWSYVIFELTITSFGAVVTLVLLALPFLVIARRSIAFSLLLIVFSPLFLMPAISVAMTALHYSLGCARRHSAVETYAGWDSDFDCPRVEHSTIGPPTKWLWITPSETTLRFLHRQFGPVHGWRRRQRLTEFEFFQRLAMADIKTTSEVFGERRVQEWGIDPLLDRHLRPETGPDWFFVVIPDEPIFVASGSRAVQIDPESGRVLETYRLTEWEEKRPSVWLYREGR